MPANLNKRSSQETRAGGGGPFGFGFSRLGEGSGEASPSHFPLPDGRPRACRPRTFLGSPTCGQALPQGDALTNSHTGRVAGAHVRVRVWQEKSHEGWQEEQQSLRLAVGGRGRGS